VVVVRPFSTFVNRSSRERSWEIFPLCYSVVLFVVLLAYVRVCVRASLVRCALQRLQLWWFVEGLVPKWFQLQLFITRNFNLEKIVALSVACSWASSSASYLPTLLGCFTRLISTVNREVLHMNIYDKINLLHSQIVVSPRVFILQRFVGSYKLVLK